MNHRSTVTNTATLGRANLRMTKALALLLMASGALMAPAVSAQQCDNVCQQEYALCIAASCMYDGSGSHALCVCDVESGWSVGPGNCADRAPVDKGKYTVMTSTFSTALYDSKPFYQGSGTNADCYGAWCASSDGEVAVCYCPVTQKTGEYWTEAGSCAAPENGNIFSGAPSPFGGGRLAELAQQIAACSGESAPSPTACPTKK